MWGRPAPVRVASRRAGSVPISEAARCSRWSPPQWSPDGTEIAVAVDWVFSGTGEIVVVKADGSGQRVLATDQAFNPTWSPDGKRIAFHRIVDESEYFQQRPCTMRVWVINADGSGERRLEPLVDGCVLPPIWSPDGTRLLSLLIVDDYFHVGVLSRRRRRSAGRLRPVVRRVLAAARRTAAAGPVVRGRRSAAP